MKERDWERIKRERGGREGGRERESERKREGERVEEKFYQNPSSSCS